MHRCKLVLWTMLVSDRYGQIIWARMHGFPFWPALVLDPRKVDSKLQAMALGCIRSKYLVQFYCTHNM